MRGSPLACFHRSNLMTYGSLSASVAAIACAGGDAIGLSGALIAAAVMLDTFDGRFARLFRRTEEQRAVGVQLDSLSDAISFGLAPATCMALAWRPAATSPGVIGVLWWTAVAAFAACAISRLAYYNVTRERTDGFIGLPAPVAALVWATVLLLGPSIAVAAVVFAVTAAAMVVPFEIPRPRGLAFAAFVCWPAAVIVAHLAVRALQ